MSVGHGAFFTSIGCMDGRVQEPVAGFGRNKFGAQFPDTITEAGLDGLLANNPPKELLESIKKKILISVEKHQSQGIVIHGHQDCAGNPVSDEQHKQDIKKSVGVIKDMLGERNTQALGVFISFYPRVNVEEIT